MKKPATTDQTTAIKNDSIVPSERGRRIVDRFIKSLSDTSIEIETALESRDIESLKDVFHQMKGIGSSVGFPEITQLATEIEAPLEDGNFDDIENLANQFIHLCLEISQMKNSINS